MDSKSYTFTMTCIAAPTQVEGRRASDGAPYYFRARGGSWYLLIGDPSWVTDLLEWPINNLDDVQVASGLDETFGWMWPESVRAILDQHIHDVTRAELNGQCR